MDAADEVRDGETAAALAAYLSVRPTERDDADGSGNGTEPSPASGAELRTWLVDVLEPDYDTGSGSAVAWGASA